MAIYDFEVGSGINSYETPWAGKSGKEVEDFITRNIIEDGEYGEDEILRLKKVGGEIVEIPVSVVKPTYDYSICLYGLRINGDVKKDTELLMQYREGSKVEVGVGIRSIMDRSGTIKNYNTTFSVKFSFNNQTITALVRNIDYNYFVTQGNDYVLDAKEDLEQALAWIDVSQLFTKVALDKKLTASFKPEEVELTKELNININNVILNLIYNGNVVTNTNYIQLLLDNAAISTSDYRLVYYNNGGDAPTILGSGQFKIENLTPGLNQIVVRAEHYNHIDICSDWITLNIIYTEGFSGTAVAVNGVNNGITNNGVATLYKVIIYSTEREEFEFTTYLETEEPSDNPNPTKIIKSEYITASSYNKDTKTTDEYTYKKYIELENTESVQYLLIKVKDSFYTFYQGDYSSISGYYYVYTSPYVKMEVEKCITEYTYVKSYPISYNFDQMTGQVNNLFSTVLQQGSNSTLIPDLESSDGWQERDGLTYLKLSKQGKPVLRNPINLNLNDSFTIELGFTTYNVSDKNQTILTIGNIGLYPTQLGWIYDDITSESFLKRNSQFQEGQNTHVVITITRNWRLQETDNYFPDYFGEESIYADFVQKSSQVSYNLVRIYINGGIDREFILTDNDLTTLKNSTLQIQPKSADIDFYLFRVYNTKALSHEEVIKNYISFLPLKQGILSKESEYIKNDILDDNGKISWSKCLGKQNTLLFIYHNGGRFPNRFWGDEDNKSSNDANKKIPCTLIINYADPNVNARYGGVLDKLQCKGQGSSAMRYLIWNVNSSLNKFKYKDAEGEEIKVNSSFLPYSNLLTREEKGNLLPENTNVDSVISKYYPMPPYENEQDTTEYKYKKMVGKVNFASSMQSHKLGACKLYDDAYKHSLGTTSLPSGGKKAVHEEPFLYFYIETDEPFNTDYSSDLDIDNITYSKIQELGEQAKFMGFQTWGPGKGDDACSGYDEDLTPEYLMLEGGENTDASVNFLRPWQALQRLRTDFVRNGAKYDYTKDLMTNPTVDSQKSKQEPWAQLLIDDESIIYTDRGAWDIDYGFEEVEVGETVYYDFTEGAKQSLLRFRDFYDSVYKYDFTFVDVDSLINTPQDDWSIYKKYRVKSSNFYINGTAVNGHAAGDAYRWDEASSSWVRAGLYYNNGWEALNFVKIIQEETGRAAQTEAQIKDILKTLFIEKIKEYVHLDDVAFHQAFIKFLSGTDNRAKNTYFQIIGTMSDGNGDYKIRLIGDDLDTILVTDNNGLQSKPYNLIEDSYDESYAKVWGDSGNIFFRMFDVSFETEIKAQLKKIMDFVGLLPGGVNLKSGYFYNAFFKIQDTFPQIAYNHTASIYYENAYIIKNCGASYGFSYTNNDVDPIAQSHGSCLECERQFVKERINFLSGYAKSCLSGEMSTSSSAGGGQGLQLLLAFEPYQDFYPTYYADGNIPNIGTYASSQYDIIKYKAVAGNTYTQEIDSASDAINQRLHQVDLYKTLSITGLQINTLDGSFNTAVDFTINNDLLEENTDIFGENYPPLMITENITADFPVLEHLNLVNVVLPKELVLSNYKKLQTVNLSNSNTEAVVFPQTGIFNSITLPSTIKNFEIYNNPGLETVVFEGYDNIENIYIDCAKCGKFDVANFCENLSSVSLKSITLKNINNIYLTEEALQRLVDVQCDLEGTITVVDSIGSTIPKAISFNTKLELVNKFGNIDTGSKGLIIRYTSSNIAYANIVFPSEVSAFYVQEGDAIQSYSNLFNINITQGNNVKIVDNPDGSARLDISYRLVRNMAGVTLDSTTGTITLDSNVDTNVIAEAIISVNTTSGTFENSSTPTKISFAWKAPQLGDFAYADGTFANYYNPNKTVVGLVYAKTEEDSENGTVYIIGKEYSNTTPHYTCYTTYEALSSAATGTIQNDMYQLQDFVESSYGLNNSKYFPNESALGSYGTGDTIPYNYIGNPTTGDNPGPDPNTIMALPGYGKQDTKVYVDLVGSILTKLNNFVGNRMTVFQDNDKTYFTSIEALNYSCSVLDESTLSNSKKYNSALLFPYFYSAYLYEPNVKEGEILHEQYRKNMWYAPSAGELAKIIYYRGYSAAINFNSANYVYEEILENKGSGGGVLDTPIFSLAKARGYLADVWGNIVGSGTTGTNNNIVTTRYKTGSSDGDCYSYQTYMPSWGDQYQHSEWVRGQYPVNSGGWQTAARRAWSYYEGKHQGIPFTEFNYSKP